MDGSPLRRITAGEKLRVVVEMLKAVSACRLLASSFYQSFPVSLSLHMLRDKWWDERSEVGEASETASDDIYVRLGCGPFINGMSPVWLLMTRAISKA